MKNKYYRLTCLLLILLLVFSLNGCSNIRTMLKNAIMAGIPEPEKRPLVFDKPGILLGQDLFSKQTFFYNKLLGSVTDIQEGNFVAGSDSVLAVSCRNGADFIDKKVQVVKTIRFNQRADHVDLIKLNQNGDFGFLNRGSWGIDPSWINSEGKTLWKYSVEQGIDDMCAGDLNKDGKLEFVVGCNGDGGVHLLDSNGKKIWKKEDGNVWHVEIADIDGKGTLGIVHSNAGGEITVRDLSGKILKQKQPGPYFSDFTLCSWPTLIDRKFPILAEDDQIWLFDFDGSILTKMPAPDSGSQGNAYGTPFVYSKDGKNGLAVLVNLTMWNQAILYVYDSTNQLIFREIINDNCESIATIKDLKSGKDVILVGSFGKIWSYTQK